MQGLADVALSRAELAIERGQPLEALEWLQRLPPEERPAGLSARVFYEAAKVEIASRHWAQAQRLLGCSQSAVPTALVQKRLELARRRRPLLTDDERRILRGAVPPPDRLSPGALQPEIAYVQACGAYYSRGSGKRAPWTRLLREAKNPPADELERQTVLRLTGGYMAECVAECFELASLVDVVVPIPADPERYVIRGLNLPTTLAGAVEAGLALPALPHMLQRVKCIELRGLTPAARREAVKGSIVAATLPLAQGRHVLLVDDVLTTGATLREAAVVLKGAGVAMVSAMVLSHTEG